MTNITRLSGDEVRKFADKGAREFYCIPLARRFTLGGLSLDCGATGFGWVWDAEAEDHEYVDCMDLTCLIPFVAREASAPA